MLESVLENRGVKALEAVYKAEAGLVLTGSEVKALKRGSGHLDGAQLKFFNHEPYLVGLKVGPYRFSSDRNFNPGRDKKVLLNRGEINKIFGLLSQKGLVCLPGKIYTKSGFLKVELLVGRVTRRWEKREKEKKVEQSRETEEYL